MSEKACWVYALPIAETREAATTTFEQRGLVPSGKHGWVNAEQTLRLNLLEREDLAVALVRAEGLEAAPHLAALLERTGFYAQTALLASAHEMGSADARQALATLAHMVVAWDAGWRDLFRAYLEASDPIDRQAGADALATAAVASSDPAPAEQLLRELRDDASG
jgi:hypothetical protein